MSVLPNFSLGVIARGLFVLVKPLALWLSINFDTDSGLFLSKLYLFGILVLAVSGTNAHKRFYFSRFDQSMKCSEFKLTRLYQLYLYNIFLQVSILLIILGLASFIITLDFWFILIGVIFGVSEKISDEGIRFVQFSKNNRRLIFWAMTKLASVLGSLILNFIFGVDISFSLPIFLFVSAIYLTKKDLFISIRNVLFCFKLFGIRLLRNGLILLWADRAQISWVFMTMSFLYIDRWILQLSRPDILANYMFISQIAAGFLILQTTFILAPKRPDIVAIHPWRISILKWGSIFLALSSIATGILVLNLDLEFFSDPVLVFPFVFMGIFTLLAPLSERLFWVSKGIHRVTIDICLMSCLLFCLVLQVFVFSNSDINVTFTILFATLILRVITISFFLLRFNNKVV